MTKKQLATLFETLSFICEDIAERIDKDSAIDEARRQDSLVREPLINREDEAE